jgi:hypothetical protein
MESTLHVSSLTGGLEMSRRTGKMWHQPHKHTDYIHTLTNRKPSGELSGCMMCTGLSWEVTWQLITARAELVLSCGQVALVRPSSS